MIIGQYYASITQKERLSVPAKFRHEIGEKLVVTKWFEGCLILVSQEKWKLLLDSLFEEMKVAASGYRETNRFLLGSAFEIELDSQGRFVVPKILKDYAHLNSEVVFLGLYDRVEIWDKAAWLKKEKYLQENSSVIVEKLVKEGGDKND